MKREEKKKVGARVKKKTALHWGKVFLKNISLHLRQSVFKKYRSTWTCLQTSRSVLHSNIRLLRWGQSESMREDKDSYSMMSTDIHDNCVPAYW